MTYININSNQIESLRGGKSAIHNSKKIINMKIYMAKAVFS